MQSANPMLPLGYTPRHQPFKNRGSVFPITSVRAEFRQLIAQSPYTVGNLFVTRGLRWIDELPFPVITPALTLNLLSCSEPYGGVGALGWG